MALEFHLTSRYTGLGIGGMARCGRDGQAPRRLAAPVIGTVRHRRMMRTFALFLALILSSVLLFAIGGCSRGEETKRNPQTSQGSLLASMSDQEKLLLIQRVPLGVTYSRVHEIIADLGPQRPEAPVGTPGMADLTDASVSVQVLGHSTQLEFNFQRDTLYSYYYGPLEVGAAVGDSLFQYLCSFYSSQYGPPIAEDAEDTPYFEKSRQWPRIGYVADVGNSIADTVRILGWGFQTYGALEPDQGVH
ncbi:MAG: hypothetical protein WAW06_12240 [bacterium]